MNREHPIGFTGEIQLSAPSILPVRNLASSFSSVNAQSHNLEIEVLETSFKALAPSSARENVYSTVDDRLFEDKPTRRNSTDRKHNVVNAARAQHVSPNCYSPDNKVSEFSLPEIELSLVLERLTSLEDLASAACVCRSV